MSRPLLPLSGYVLAGGKSSRMGSDKALLQLAGKTLAQRAVDLLTPICGRVSIVGPPALSSFAPTIPDTFEACGPLGGIEAALRDSQHDWLFCLPVDLPFLPPEMLFQWASAELQPDTVARICYFEADNRPQPLVCLLHRSLLPDVQQALGRKQYKVTRLYQEIAEHLAPRNPAQILHKALLDGAGRLSVEHSSIGKHIAWTPTPYETAQKSLWFSNLNTPGEFAHAEKLIQQGNAIESRFQHAGCIQSHIHT